MSKKNLSNLLTSKFDQTGDGGDSDEGDSWETQDGTIDIDDSDILGDYTLYDNIEYPTPQTPINIVGPKKIKILDKMAKFIILSFNKDIIINGNVFKEDEEVDNKSNVRRSHIIKESIIEILEGGAIDVIRGNFVYLEQ